MNFGEPDHQAKVSDLSFFSPEMSLDDQGHLLRDDILLHSEDVEDDADLRTARLLDGPFTPVQVKWMGTLIEREYAKFG